MGRENDFVVKGGDGTPRGAGRCVVEGWDILNETDLRYSEQPLFTDPDKAAAWGVAQLAPLTTPTVDRTDLVYVDIWEREVNAEEDPNLINPDIGFEAMVRIKREWAIRVAEGATSLTNPPDGHVFYALAALTRPAAAAVITDEQILDLRETNSILVQDGPGVGLHLDHKLTATADNDTLIGARVCPTFDDKSFAEVQHFDLVTGRPDIDHFDKGNINDFTSQPVKTGNFQRVKTHRSSGWRGRASRAILQGRSGRRIRGAGKQLVPYRTFQPRTGITTDQRRVHLARPRL